MKKLLFLLPLLFFKQGFAQNNDTILVSTLPVVHVTAERNWGNDTIAYRYNQMKYYITTILPYLNAATILFNELEAKCKDPNIGKYERKLFVRNKEKELKQTFENKISKLNETQGVLLMKLISRQTGANIYEMLQEFKNPFTAIKWQAWARLHGFNLNRTYVPDEEPMLESIMESLDYPLPELYGPHERFALRNDQVYYQTKRRAR